MKPAAHLCATIEILEDVLQATTPVDRLTTSYFKSRRYAGSKDRRAITERLFRILRSRAKLEYLLGRTDLNLTGRNLVLADCIRNAEPVHELFDGSSYGPAPLKDNELEAIDHMNNPALEEAPDWVSHEYPDWLEAELTRSLGPDLSTVMTALNCEAPLDLRVNPLLSTLEEAQTALSSQNIEAHPGSFSPYALRCAKKVKLGGIKAYQEGSVDVQDEGSQLIALLSDPANCELVMDFCAGAGGKTLALAAQMNNQGTLYATDIAPKRLYKMKPRLSRAGVKNVHLQPISGANDKWLKPFENRVERLLVDAPCSGIGAWRRSPESRWKLTPEMLEDMQNRQRQILETAGALVKPGGRLIYATCSLLKSENHDQIAHFLETQDAFRLVPICEVWQQVLNSPCPTKDETLLLRPDQHGTDGFFVAIFEKSG